MRCVRRWMQQVLPFYIFTCITSHLMAAYQVLPFWLNPISAFTHGQSEDTPRWMCLCVATQNQKVQFRYSSEHLEPITLILVNTCAGGSLPICHHPHPMTKIFK
ncbi:UNVERIFIED_CONTAM: hypothetical protein GTU68_063346 [Idotea baltica]|nr:hypothetical protein [Idotea baltica]